MSQKEDCISLYCSNWDVPECELPRNPIIVKLSVAAARAVLKKQSAIRIPSSLSKIQNIVVKQDVMRTYSEFSLFIKTASKFLDVSQNVIFFSDVDDQHKFIHNINCLWAAAMHNEEISVLAVTLNDDLSCRMVRWEKVSEEVFNDLKPPQEIGEKSQSISSIQPTNSATRKHKAIELFNEEAEIEFSGPVFKKNNDDCVCSITVWKRYVPLLLSLNSLLFTIDNQFKQIMRTTPVDEKIVEEICRKVLEEHSIELSD